MRQTPITGKLVQAITAKRRKKANIIANSTFFGTIAFCLLLFYGSEFRNDDYLTLCCILAVGFALAVGFYLWGNRSHPCASIVSWCQKQPNPEQEMQKIDAFSQTIPEFKGLRANADYFLAIVGTRAEFAPASECVWCYRYVFTQFYLFIPISSDHKIIMRLADGSAIEIPLGMEIPFVTSRKAIKMMEYISSQMPFLAFGYTDELKAAYDDAETRQLFIKDIKQRCAYFKRLQVERNVHST